MKWSAVDILLVALAVGICLFFLGFLLVVIYGAATEMNTSWAK